VLAGGPPPRRRHDNDDNCGGMDKATRNEIDSVNNVVNKKGKINALILFVDEKTMIMSSTGIII
jgi:hypothetical protein